MSDLDKLLAESRELDRQVDRMLEGNGQPLGPPPDPPGHLDEVATAKWRELATAGMDTDLLEVYCTTWSRWRSSAAQVQELGSVIKSPSGFPVQNPYLSICNRAAVDLLKIGKRLGLPTP
jgi:P27 family predicted phage terminase small subunit